VGSTTLLRSRGYGGNGEIRRPPLAISCLRTAWTSLPFSI
jgi:hypothetical protein